MMDMNDFAQLAERCAPTVHPATLQRVVHVESSFNPYAIGVVGGALRRQPRRLSEALDAIAKLELAGANYSVGIAQINKHNFSRYGLTARSAFDPCTNVGVGAAILTRCYQRALVRYPAPQRALRAAFSCYESGNFETGMRDGYVMKLVRHARPDRTQNAPAVAFPMSVSSERRAAAP